MNNLISNIYHKYISYEDDIPKSLILITKNKELKRKRNVQTTKSYLKKEKEFFRGLKK